MQIGCLRLPKQESTERSVEKEVNIVAKQMKISEWILANVPDDAEWSEVYITACKEETRSGNRVNITQSLRGVREVSITGKEVKDYMDWQGSPITGIVLSVIGVICAILAILLREPMNMSRGAMIVGLVIAVGMIISGAYLVFKSKKSNTEVLSIASWESFEPWISMALGEKVFNEEVAAREKEFGDKGKAYSGHYCIPARLAAQGIFNTAVSSTSTKGTDGIYFNFAPYDALKQTMKEAAIALPAEQRERKRTK